MTSEQIAQSLGSLRGWIESNDYCGYEPSDGNLSPLHALTFEVPLLEQILQQVIWKSPVDIRRLVRVPRHRSTKGMGYMAWGYTTLYQLTGSDSDRERATFCLNWLLQNRSPHHAEYCWGDSFPFSSRGGRRPAFEPTIVWSSLIGQTFLDAQQVIQNDEYSKVASSICSWIKKLPRNRQDHGLCLGYTALGKSTVHNSNMLGAAFLARAGTLTGDPEALDLAAHAMEYSCTHQRENGSWFYAEASRHHWIDSFHTGYNLDSLRGYMQTTGDQQYEPNLRRGFDFFKAHFFERDGRPKYYHNKTYPIDIQCASQAIETLTRFADYDREALELAQRVADWTVSNMQDRDGHFYYRDLGWKKVKTPMFHWGQATMFRALASLLSSLQNRGSV